MPSAAFHLLPNVSDPSWVTWAAQGAPCVKVAHAGAIAPAKGAGAWTYYRPCFLATDNGEGDCGDGAAWAGAVIAELGSRSAPWPSALGFRNELRATAANTHEYWRYRAALRRAGFTGPVYLGSYAVGTPDWPDYATLLAEGQPDGVDAHEYWDLTVAGSSPWWALRHVEAIRRGLLPADLPLLIGEIGSDALWKPDGTPLEDPQKRRGWNDRGKLTAAEQGANIVAYVARCAPSVRAAFVFADGDNGNHDWDSYKTRGTGAEAAIRATWRSPLPPAPSHQKGHPGMPAPPVIFDQGYTNDCWVRCLQTAFLRYGYSFDVDTIFQACKGHARPSGGETANFAEVEQGVRVLCAQLGVKYQLAEFDDPPTVWAAVHDPDAANPWTIIIGVDESVLQPGQQYGHFMLLLADVGDDNVRVGDSYAREDGDATGIYAWSVVARAMIASWEPRIDGIGLKLVA